MDDLPEGNGGGLALQNLQLGILQEIPLSKPPGGNSATEYGPPVPLAARLTGSLVAMTWNCGGSRCGRWCGFRSNIVVMIEYPHVDFASRP